MNVLLSRGQSWAHRARCVGAGDAMFDEIDTAPAKAICAACPVRRQCLLYALDGEIGYGVWGGLDFDERCRTCPICRGPKLAVELGCCEAHSLERLTRLMELEADGDATISVNPRIYVTAPTSPGCLQPRGRSHTTAKAYRQGCRCPPALRALQLERAIRGPVKENPQRTSRDRFMSFVSVVDGEHWIWNGSKNGSGYGNFWDGTRTVRAHLFAYLEFIGPVPDKGRLRAPRACAALRCANPYHHKIEEK